MNMLHVPIQSWQQLVKLKDYHLQKKFLKKVFNIAKKETLIPGRLYAIVESKAET